LTSILRIKDYSVWVHPTDYGVLSYERDEPIYLGLSFPIKYTYAVEELLRNFNDYTNLIGHFQPTETVILEQVINRIESGDEYMTYETIEYEVEVLSKLRGCTMHLYSPLDLKKPSEYRYKWHKSYDAEIFYLPHYEDAKILSHLLNSIRASITPKISEEDIGNTHLIPQGLSWFHISYGKDKYKKTYGGLVGELKLKGSISREVAERLVLGQYFGMGFNYNLGFGFYNIPETDFAKKIKPMKRGMTILERAINIESLKKSLRTLDNSGASGFDGLTVEDVKSAGSPYIQAIVEDIHNDRYKQEKVRIVKIPKVDSNKKRVIKMLSVRDRLVHKAIADYLYPIIDNRLSKMSYAFRRNVSRRQTVYDIRRALSDKKEYGIKGDIESFFDTINLDILKSTLNGLLPFEPLIERIITMINEIQAYSNAGIPQGSPLSPLLSNLYLDMFDREIVRKGFMFFRYCDDFVLLTNDESRCEEALKLVKDELSKLGLSLNKDKTAIIKKDTPIEFLGYRITKDHIEEVKKKN
jgi:RNA-directed DNA polymerase